MKKQSGIGFTYKDGILVYLNGNIFFLENNKLKMKPIQPDYRVFKLTDFKNFTIRMEIK